MEISRFPNKLRIYRRRNGYSQKKVSRLLGFADTSTISRWERGNAFPGLLQVFRLARIYHAQPEELFDELWNEVSSDKSLLTHEESFNTNQSFFV